VPRSIPIRAKSGSNVFFSLLEGFLLPEMPFSDLDGKRLHVSIKVIHDLLLFKFLIRPLTLH
jgi:predicted DNA-binding transcriptional regulator YafY